MGYCLDQLVACDAVVKRPPQMKGHLIDAIERDEARHRDQAAIARGKARAFPHIAEQHPVRVIGESRRNVRERIARRGSAICGEPG